MARITAFIESGTSVTINGGEHIWYSDEPASQGGTDQGPTPYEMLLGSLAACTALTLRLYADRKGIALKWVRAEYEYDRIHAKDCEECESTEQGLIERVQAFITLGGSFDDAQRTRLEEIAGRCPVHKTLTHGMNIFDQVRFMEGENGMVAGPAAT